MPRAKAAAKGRSGASCISSGSLTDGHGLAKGGKLLPSQSENAAKPFRRVEAPHSIAFVDDAPGEAWADAGQPRDLLHGCVIDVERTRVNGRGRRRGSDACP